MKTASLWLALALSILLAACSAGQQSTDSRPPAASGDTTYIENPRTLADILVREPGVSFVNGRLTIRGQTYPLFVVDGTPIGRGYANAASAVSVEDIRSVEVLKGASETAIYGRQGANGVILITTKKGGE
ncbi:MAG: TonB-dependent receptor plug domain-containing protein [Bacteroidetes bacterium]|jgi:TonB-dependent SusC/RagA subfamily outer membrane receptor|nr:TonB-dependent receptor plug domain-containing protein [Bacteroidota bacterium]